MQPVVLGECVLFVCLCVVYVLRACLSCLPIRRELSELFALAVDLLC